MASPTTSNKPKTISTFNAPSRLCFPFPLSAAFDGALPPPPPPPPGTASAPASSAAELPSSVRIPVAKTGSNGGSGPAFVGQVFSMCDLSGTGLMAVSTHFDVPFISKRTPEWLKKMFATVTRSERKKGPVFRFFLDLGDAVSYVKRLNIPSGVVGACRLDLAYEHFKEKPHLFQFVPNEKQVKEANKLLRTMPQSNDGCKKVEGVPVFSAHNLDIAIATTEGIKWYTPYFFDKSMLDNILEESVDQHFNSMIQTRHVQRRRDVIDDNISAEVMEEMGDNLWEPPEVHEAMEEMGNPGIPLSVITKAAEMQLLYTVDRVLLGNKWLRKAMGIQPKFPYMVDSFEKRSAASALRALSTPSIANSEAQNRDADFVPSSGAPGFLGQSQTTEMGVRDLRLPFGNWLGPKQSEAPPPKEWQSQFLPKITMVGVSTGEMGEMSKAKVKRTMKDLTNELEHIDQGNDTNALSDEFRSEDRDPLFVANVGDYQSGNLAKSGNKSARWIRRAS